MSANSNPRLCAANILRQVLSEGKSLTTVLTQANKSSEVGLTKELCFGVCRYYFQLKFILSQLMKKTIKPKEIDVEILLLLGIYELTYLKTAEYAVVSEVVNSIRQLKKTWAINLSNAVLRSFLRQKDALLMQIENDSLAKYSWPKWLMREIKNAWPENWEVILEQGNIPAPMTLRVNNKLISTKDYLQLLDEANIKAVANDLCASAVILENACNVDKLPKFADGYCSVQDLAAQLAANFLQLEPGQRVLDSCAAPGGKTCHILEMEPELSTLIALDEDAERIKKIHVNLQRLHLNAEVKVAKAEYLDSWWNGECFDRILLDAPCSAVGVIRRHPDIKLLRQKSDIDSLVKIQRTLLLKLWKTLKPAGLLLYTTCSILPIENSENIAWFLEDNQDAKLIPLDHPNNHESIGLQLFPGDGRGDGFYYCLLRKQEAPLT